MKCLSLWRPWNEIILHGEPPKDCENRTWPPPRAVIGTRIALHNGLRYELGEWPRGSWTPPGPEESPKGAVVGVATVLGYRDERHARPRIECVPPWDPRREAAVARLHDLDLDPYWSGPVGWLFGEKVALAPVPCRGAQGLFTLPPEVNREVIAQIEALRAKGVPHA